MDSQSTEITYEAALFDDFYRIYAKKDEPLTHKEEELLWRLVQLCTFRPYDCTIKPSVVRKALKEAKKTGKKIRIVPDAEFWKNGKSHGQCDGWSYHLVLYTPANTVNGIHFRKNHRTDKIWWVEHQNEIGLWEFSFDKLKIFNMYRDYPHELSPEEKELFDKENPYWKEYFKDRQ